MRKALTVLLCLTLPAAAQPMLRVGLTGQQAGTLDPHRATATEDMTLVGWMFSGLLRFPPGSADPAKLEPDVAERVDSSPDGLTWTFRIHPGVQFHGGHGTVAATPTRIASSPTRTASLPSWRSRPALGCRSPG